MKKNTENKGFTLVELIVTIAVIAVLTGTLIPAFTKYANTRRQQACRANRETLLNIYEKAVYDNQLCIKKADLEMILDASGSKLTTEYTNQAADYLICPDAKEKGHYSAQITNGVAYVVCDCHKEDICSVNFDYYNLTASADEADESYGKWSSENDLLDPSLDPDPVYTIPSGAGDGLGGGASDPEEEEVIPVDTTQTCNTGIWPRPMNNQGQVDSRWASVGLKSGNTVSIDAPVYFTDVTGVDIVIVAPNNGGKYTVQYEDAMYPAGKGANALENVVAASGIIYTVDNPPAHREMHGESISKEVVDYGSVTYKYSNRVWVQTGKYSGKYIHYACDDLNCKDRGVREHAHDNVPIGSHWETEYGETYIEYRVNYGDMLMLNGVTYIYADNTGESSYVRYPKEDEKTLGVNYNGWYVVPEKTPNIQK